MNDLHLMPHQEDALNRTEQFNRCAYYLDDQFSGVLNNIISSVKDHIKKGGKKHEKVRKSTQYKAA